jgi:hypothetical protein
MEKAELAFDARNIKFTILPCRVCRTTVMIACDDPAALYDIVVLHPSHEVFFGKDEVATWSNTEGGLHASLKDDIILRITEAGLTLHGAPLGYKRASNLARDQAPYTACTAKEFMTYYATDSGVTVQFLKDHGYRSAFVRSCNQYDFPHWEMARITDDDFDRLNEIIFGDNS